MRMGLRKNSKHPTSVDGVLFTAQHKAASRAETLGLLLTMRKAGRRNSRGERRGSGERAQEADGALRDGLWLG